MLKLSEYEQAMLDGAYGPMKQKALENICRYAKALNVDELCEVEYSTMFIGAHGYLEVCGEEDPGKNFAIMNMGSDEEIPMSSFCKSCVCHTCVEAFDPETADKIGIPHKEWQKNEDYVKYMTDAGVIRAATCTPYLNGWIPLKGQHFVTTESSNVLLCNSLFGACGNPDGIEASFWASLCGRIPKYGKHDPKNRFGNCLVEIEKPIETSEDWDLLGYIIGKKAPQYSTPVMKGQFVRPNIYKFKQFAASCAVVSNIDMVHIVGMTPEALTEEMAFGGKEPESYLKVTAADFAWAVSQLSDPGEGSVNYVTLGCPHYSIYEIQQVAEYVKGKKVAPGVTFHVWTNYAMRALARLNGYEKIIQDAGGELMAAHCPYGIFEYPNVRDAIMPVNAGLVTDSVKIATDLPPMCNPGVRTYYGDTWRCIDAAVRGSWR